ncbi:MAG: uroporphyrinogen-III C-methyltransferase [Woeseiaceae bacterium]|nr:uroporphyrinogen-III C-methyltransferase [Woeseiaceae bacterium]
MSTKDKKAAEDTATDDAPIEVTEPPEAPEPLAPPEPPEPELAEKAPPPAPGKSGGRLLSLAAMLFSIVAIAAVGFVLWKDYQEAASTQNNTDSLSQLDARMQSSRETILSMQDRLSEQADANSALRSRVAELESTLADPAALLGSIPARTSSLERGLSALQGVSSGTRDSWLLAEAEYFLQIANAQVQLADNPTLAAAALRQADDRIADVSSPVYTDVRAAIANELAALELVNEVDVTGMTMTLASLAKVVDSLPIQAVDSISDDEEDAVDEELSGVDRAWASVKDAMSGLVKVTKPEERGSPLLTPDSVALLRANLELQLQAARLALLKGERAVFQQSLLDAEDWMMTYFDIRSVQVASALETITEIRNSPAMGELPDISESLQLLRQQRVLDENQQ